MTEDMIVIGTCDLILDAAYVRQTFALIDGFNYVAPAIMGSACSRPLAVKRPASAVSILRLSHAGRVATTCALSVA